MKVTKHKELYKPVEKRGDKYVVSFGFKAISDAQAQWEESSFDHRPSVEEIRRHINGFYNAQAQEKIVGGMRYGGGFVWLSQENQQNYNRAYNMAMSAKSIAVVVNEEGEQVQPSETPFEYTIKLTDKDGNDFYHTFTTAESYFSFYRQVSNYINLQVSNAWALKDAIDYSDYENA